MFELKNINAGYDNRRLVLYDVSAKIRGGAITVIMGPNGAGKSTMLKVMYGLLKPQTGEIFFSFDDDDCFKPTPTKSI